MESYGKKVISLRTVGVASLFLLGSAVVAGVPITPLRNFSARLPSGEGKILVLKYCVSCHGAAVARSRLEAGNWMSDQWGSVMDSEDMAPLERYLEENFGSGSKKSALGGREALEAFLPSGEPRKVVLEKCAVCHDPQVTRRRMESRAGVPASVWKKILARMNDYGASLTESEMEQLSGYLERGLPSGSGPEGVPELSSFLPEGKGKDLVLAYCLSCHGAAELKRKIEGHAHAGESYWVGVVGRMKDQWEVPLPEEDVTEILQYLKAHFTDGLASRQERGHRPSGAPSIRFVRRFLGSAAKGWPALAVAERNSP